MNHRKIMEISGTVNGRRTIRILTLILTGILVFTFSGCGKQDRGNAASSDSGDPSSGASSASSVSAASTSGESVDEASAVSSSSLTDLFSFVDDEGVTWETKINRQVPMNNYDLNAFVTGENGRMQYQDLENYESRTGVDVSEHNGTIDWNAAASDGIDFAVIRIGCRGYGADGTVVADSMALDNIRRAHSAGLEVGVYFFSQALDEKEAEEEAEFVLQMLGDIQLELPVFYDPEHVRNVVNRNDNVTKEQFTINALTFCETIEDAGYQAGIYANMYWEAFKLNLEKLTGYPLWYADYEALPQTPYNYEYWQYGNQGKVNGITSDGLDMDIRLIPVS